MPAGPLMCKANKPAQEEVHCESRGSLPIGATKARFGVGNGGATGAARPSPVSAALSPAAAHFPPGTPPRGCPGTNTYRRSRAVRCYESRVAGETLVAVFGGFPPKNPDTRVRPARHVTAAERYQGEVPLTRAGPQPRPGADASNRSRATGRGRQ